MAPTRKVMEREARFVTEYLIDLNGTAAARRAGYVGRNAEQIGSELLGRPRVLAMIATAQAVRAQRTGITSDRVLLETELLAFSDVSHYEVDDDGKVTLAPDAPPGALRALSSIKRRVTVMKNGDTTREVELKLWEKPGTLKLAGRHVGLFPDRVEVTGANGGPIRSVHADVQFMTTVDLKSEIEALLAKL